MKATPIIKKKQPRLNVTASMVSSVGEIQEISMQEKIVYPSSISAGHQSYLSS